MNNKDIIGITESKKFIYSDPSLTANKHLAVFGKSGCGKTTYVLTRINQLLSMGFSVVVLNWRKALDHSLMNPEILPEYMKYVKVIDVARDGIQIPLFDSMIDNHGAKETETNIRHRIASILSIAADLTPSQANEVYGAVKVIQEENSFPVNGIAAITDYLETMDRRTALNAANKLRPLCDNNIIRDGDFWETKPTIYEFDLNRLEYDDQSTVVRFILDYLARMANRGLFIKKGLAVFVDECHNLDFSTGSTICTLINESRKLNIRLMLATTELKVTGKSNMSVMLQSGECVFFEPQANQRKLFAELVDARKADKWLFKLSKLKKGQFVMVGNHTDEEGSLNNSPIVLRTHMGGSGIHKNTETVDQTEQDENSESVNETKEDSRNTLINVKK